MHISLLQQILRKNTLSRLVRDLQGTISLDFLKRAETLLFMREYHSQKYK